MFAPSDGAGFINEYRQIAAQTVKQLSIHAKRDPETNHRS